MKRLLVDFGSDSSDDLGRVRALYARQSVGVRLYVRLRLAFGLLSADLLNSYLAADGTVVDIGCGYGVLANQLALGHEGRSVLGIDSDPRRIGVARSTVGK